MRSTALLRAGLACPSSAVGTAGSKSVTTHSDMIATRKSLGCIVVVGLDSELSIASIQIKLPTCWRGQTACISAGWNLVYWWGDWRLTVTSANVSLQPRDSIFREPVQLPACHAPHTTHSSSTARRQARLVAQKSLGSPATEVKRTTRAAHHSTILQQLSGVSRIQLTNAGATPLAIGLPRVDVRASIDYFRAGCLSAAVSIGGRAPLSCGIGSRGASRFDDPPRGVIAARWRSRRRSPAESGISG